MSSLSGSQSAEAYQAACQNIVTQIRSARYALTTTTVKNSHPNGVREGCPSSLVFSNIYHTLALFMMERAVEGSSMLETETFFTELKCLSQTGHSSQVQDVLISSPGNRSQQESIPKAEVRLEGKNGSSRVFGKVHGL